MKDSSFLFLLFFFPLSLQVSKFFECRSYLLLVTDYECIVPENYQSSRPTGPFKTAFAVHTQAFMFLFLKYLLIKHLFIFVQMV